MRITEYMKRLSKTENGEQNGGLSENINSDIEFDEKIEIEDPLDIFPISNIWGTRNIEEEKIYNEWCKKIGNMSLDITPFRDAEFLRTFLKDIPIDQQFNYVYNTVLYLYNKENYDARYVILTRRTIPSLEDKPEQFWTSIYSRPMNGLNIEIPKGSPQRLHSVILVTTLNALEKYGFAINHGGTTDGEIMINNIPFSRKDIIFVHKSSDEIENLISYLNNGGMHNSELLRLQKILSEDIQNQSDDFDYIESPKKII